MTLSLHLIYLLRCKPFLFIFVSAGIFRVVISLFIHPNTPSNLGPDEGTYGALASWVASGKSVNDFPAYGPGLYNTSRALTLPSALLVKLGIPELAAVRGTSVTYGILSVFLLALCLLLLSTINSPEATIEGSKFNSYGMSLLAIFAFLPSNLIWSTIGLRETASAFWILTSFFSLIKLHRTTKGIHRVVWGLTLSICLTMSFGARRETALVFTLSLIVFCLFSIKSHKNFFPILSICMGLIGGSAFTSTPIPERLTNNNVSEGSQLNIEGSPENRISPLKSISSQLATIRILEYKRNVNRLDAQSALPKSTCQITTNSQISLMLCNISELPYRLFAFLFRPLPILDSGSLSLTLAGYENIFWIAFLSYAIFLCSKFMRYSGLQRALMFTLGTYFAIFSTAAALYEGNLGTAFRHKSTLLWVCASVIYISSINRESRKDSA